MSAPAPSKSSKHGRSDPSDHLSPHAITTTGPSESFSPSATAERLRKHAATTAAPASAAIAVQVDPLGDGKTTASPPFNRQRLSGESDGPEGSEPSASVAPTDSANAGAESSRQRYGKTDAPRPKAASTAVVNRRTSMTATTAAPTASAAVPVVPHSKRTS
jgi:hypothetical protein